MIASDRDSIFGDTYAGVPNPQIPIEHPWPTRYHGPIFTTPRFGMPFVSRPYARLPYSGTEAPTDPPLTTGVGFAVVAGAVVGAVAGGLAGRSRAATPQRVARTAGVAGGVAGPALLAITVAVVLGGMGGAR